MQIIGKSSQIPQFLLEANVKPILCTQPRRFAVVAVAKMVAQARNSELGGEVGYHIGHSKHVSPRCIMVLAQSEMSIFFLEAVCIVFVLMLLFHFTLLQIRHCF